MIYQARGWEALTSAYLDRVSVIFAALCALIVQLVFGDVGRLLP
jgi:hypothetical protein